MRKIGILGGMGPLAGIQLFYEVLNETRAESDDQHFPVALLSYPGDIPPRPKFLSGEIRVNPAFAIVKILKEFEKLNVSVVGIPCITAHAPQIFDIIKKEFKNGTFNFQLFNLLEQTAKYISKNYSKDIKIAVLGTKETIEHRIFKRYLNEEGLYNLIYPSSYIINNYITPLIFDKVFGVKATGDKPSAKAEEYFEEVIESDEILNADVVILGCTELSIVAKEIKSNKIFADPLRILAKTIINYLK